MKWRLNLFYLLGGGFVLAVDAESNDLRWRKSEAAHAGFAKVCVTHVGVKSKFVYKHSNNDAAH